MKWLEKYMYYLSERRRRELHFLDILFGDTVDMYQLSKVSGPFVETSCVFQCIKIS